MPLSATIVSASASRVLIDLEVRDAAGALVYQKVWDGEAFTTGQSRSFTTAWAIPTNAAPGLYTVTLGVFGEGWGALYQWNDRATTFTVV